MSSRRITPCVALASLLAAAATAVPVAVLSAEPSFDCTAIEAGSIPALVCDDEGLAALDRRLAEVYAAARAQPTGGAEDFLTAEQRGWIKGRDECWKADDQPACVAEEYRLRIAELEARYRLVPSRGPYIFICGDAPGSEVVVTFHGTEPPTLIAERGDQVSLMYLVPAASGAKYEGRNQMFWEHQGEATLRWGYDAPEITCRTP